MLKVYENDDLVVWDYYNDNFDTVYYVCFKDGSRQNYFTNEYNARNLIKTVREKNEK